MRQCLITIITARLRQLPGARNLARLKLVARFLIGLLRSRNVPFCEVTWLLNDAAKPASDESRIQDFFRQVILDALTLALLMVCPLPGQGKGCRYLDRAEWNWGQCLVNPLLVTMGRGEGHARPTGICSMITAVIPMPPSASPCSRRAWPCWAGTKLSCSWGNASS